MLRPCPMIVVKRDFNLSSKIPARAHDLAFTSSVGRRIERSRSRKHDDGFNVIVCRRCDYVVEVRFFLVNGGMSRPSPISHCVVATKEFVEVGEIAHAGFAELEASGFDDLAFSALVFVPLLEWRVLAIADRGVGDLTEVRIHERVKDSIHDGSPKEKAR